MGPLRRVGKAPAKRKEHYGIEGPSRAMRTLTEGQAGQIHAQQEVETTLPARGVAWVSAETDGSMLPLVETAAPATGEPGGERRKTRPVRWQAARLSVAHAQGAGTPTFAAT